MKEYTKDELAVIALDSLQGFEYKHKARILSLLSHPAELLEDEKKAREVIYAVVKESKAKTVALSLDGEYVEKRLKNLDKSGVFVITSYSGDYPADFERVDSPPLCVYCKGNEKLLNAERKFAIVGSRKSLPDVCFLARDHAKRLAESGVCLVTGSAGGADSAVVEGALPSGNIISVIAGGFDHVYPAYNKRLVDKVAESGLVISEQPPETEVRPWMFPVRNRLIAGLGRGVLIVSGKFDSGARHTADFALEYGKEVFAYPYGIGITSGELCNRLIKNGAALLDDAGDILSFFGIKDETEKPVELDELSAKVLGLISDGVDEADKLVKALDMKMFELAPTLTDLELNGFIVRIAGNKYKKVK